MSYERLASRLYNCPLLITPEKAEVIERVFRAHLDGTVAELPPYDAKARPEILTQTSTTFTRQRGGYMRSDSGVALIQVVGSLVQRATPGPSMSSESYENIGAQVQAALNDPQVRGILLELDSPGGEAAGVAALAENILAASESVPVVAHANEMAFSAAYWLAASAEELYVPKTGMVGSVGVIMLHVDQSQANAKRGLAVTHITAGARKADFSSHQPLSETALANAQAIVDRLYGQFVGHVAQARGISPDVVRGTEAGLLNPDQAVELGMVTGVATLDGSLQRLHTLMNDRTQRKQYGSAAMSARLSSTAQPDKEQDMSDATKGAAPPQAAAITPEQLASATATAAADAAKAAKDAERARISGITGHAEAAGREKLAAHFAHNTDMSVDDAAKALAAAPKESAAAPANLLAAAMAKVPNPKVGAEADEGERAKATPPNPAAVYAFRRDCVAKARGRAA